MNTLKKHAQVLAETAALIALLASGLVIAGLAMGYSDLLEKAGITVWILIGGDVLYVFYKIYWLILTNKK